ncbi:MAG: 5-(carboxyamino)imidazole ribonucleotide mutase [Bdellovibrionales bacterium]|nr:5-(carboxyamino)imidazole ribonucleotide mutase [Bdellovibrionales bacterium]
MKKKSTINKNRVSVIMGSDSDWPAMEAAIPILENFHIPYEVKVVSAHRTPEMMQKYAKECKGRGIKVIIAGAGGAAHLPGMVASLTPLPVIGVPIMTKKLKGLDSLLSVAQMPRGVPVATVAVDNAHNAALLAVRILALFQREIMKKNITYMRQQKAKSKAKKVTPKISYKKI